MYSEYVALCRTLGTVFPLSNEPPVSYIDLNCFVARRPIPHSGKDRRTCGGCAGALARADRWRSTPRLVTRMSKYSGLPDIVCIARLTLQDTAPDVYETNPVVDPAKHDVPEGLDDDEVEAPPEGLERTSLNAHAARSRFREAAPPTMQGTSETPLARLLRLQDEAKELEESLSADPTRTEHQGAVRLLEQIQRLQIHAASKVPPLDPKETMNMIENLGHGDSTAASEASAPSLPTTTVPPLSTLALRLSQLEQLIGTPDDAEAVVPLVSTLARLESQIQLLTQPRHLDTIVHRAKMASAELDRVAENRKRIANHDEVSSETLSQIESLSALQSRIEPLVPLAPALLARLQALAPLHASATSFAAQVSDVEQAQHTQRTRMAELREMLEHAEASLAQNVQVTQSNLASLQARLAAIEARLS